MLRVIREMQIKTTMRYYLTRVRIAIIHKKQTQHVLTQMGRKITAGGNVTWQLSSSVQLLSSVTIYDHSSKASILRLSDFFIVQHSHPYMTTGKTIALTRWTFVGKVNVSAF